MLGEKAPLFGRFQVTPARPTGEKKKKKKKKKKRCI